MNDPLPNSLIKIGARLSKGGFSNEEVQMHLDGLSRIAIDYDLTDAQKIIKKYVSDKNFVASFDDDMKSKFDKLHDSFDSVNPDPTIELDLQQRIQIIVASILERKMSSQPPPSIEAKSTPQSEPDPTSFPKSEVLGSNTKADSAGSEIGDLGVNFAGQGNNFRKPNQEQVQEQHIDKEQRVPLSLTESIGHGFTTLINKLTGTKPPGKSYSKLVESGHGLGMNNPILDPVLLTNTAMARLETSVNALTLLQPDADPFVVAQAKSKVLDAAGDAQRYIGNENRENVVKLSQGKLNEFDASDAMDERSKKFEAVLNKAAGCHAAKDDESFQSSVLDAVEKSKLMIQQMMDAIKSMATSLFGQTKKLGSASSPG